MSDAADERPWPGDWVVWVRDHDGPHLGRVVGSAVDRRSGEHEGRLYRVQPSSTDRRRDPVDPSSIMTLIRTGGEGEGEKIVALLQHERPDIREMALRAIAEHTGERWRPPMGWNDPSVRDSIGRWRGDDDAYPSPVATGRDALERWGSAPTRHPSPGRRSPPLLPQNRGQDLPQIPTPDEIAAHATL